MKLALGTVQFGLDYGVSNQQGQVYPKEITKILKLAKAHHIDTLDTATAYGNSEKILGDSEFIHDFKIVSKIPPLAENDINIESHINNSLKQLKIEQLEAVLFHRVADIIDLSFGKARFDALIAQKNANKIKKIGISVYTPEQLEYCYKHYQFDLVQLPLNCLDQRFKNNHWLDKLNDSGIEIHVRSLFLQGLLLMSMNKIDNYFKPYLPILLNFFNKAKKLRISPLTLALVIACQLKNINRIVVGCCNTKQLEEIITAYHLAMEIDDDLSHLTCNDEQILIPSNWQIGL